ncbi:MAG: radical SAM protein [Chitinivibrionales bacterium]|nr:radical SAM protein [Chitinivibrionales bacterium]
METLQFCNKLLTLGDKRYPTSAIVELTRRCNASCDYCFIKNPASRDLSTDSIKLIINKLANAGILFLGFTGGELFMRDDILDILSYAVEKNFWRISLLTNGTLITAKHIDFLLSHSRYWGVLRFSLYSINPQINDSYMGIEGACRKIIEIGTMLLRSGIKVEIALNLLDYNFDTFQETFRYLKDSGFSIKIGIKKVYARNSISQNKQRINDSTSIELFSKIVPFIKKNATKPLEKPPHDRISPQDLKARGKDLCTGFYTSVTINADGNIIPCIGFPMLQFGSILNDEPLRSLLEKSAMIPTMHAIRTRIRSACASCTFINTCSICPGAVFDGTDVDKNALLQFCNYTKVVTNINSFEMTGSYE